MRDVLAGGGEQFDMKIIGLHDHVLTLLSVVIAILASFTALDLAGLLRATAGQARTIWPGAASLAFSRKLVLPAIQNLTSAGALRLLSDERGAGARNAAMIARAMR